MESLKTPSIDIDQIEELLQRATKDALSGLLNRATMEMHISQRLNEMSQDESCALFIIDLDAFKRVNDTLGHQAGDMAIQESAKILSHIFRGSDIVGRLGGDEFAVFMCGADITEDLVRNKGAAICDNLQMTIGDKGDVPLTASVGISFYKGAEKFDKMYQDADLALYKAKKTGKNTYCLKSWDFYHGRDESDDYHLVNTIPIGSLLEGLDSGIALLEVDDEINVIYVSPNLAKMLHIGKDVKLPIPVSTWIHPDDYQVFKTTLEKAIVSGEQVGQTQRVKINKNEDWTWWHIKAVRIKFSSTKPVVLVTTNDVTDFKEKEKELQKENELLQAAFAQTSQHLWQVDIERRLFITYDMTGSDDKKEMTFSFPDELIANGIIHANSVDKFKEFSKGLLSGQTEGYGTFIVRYQETGSYGWVAMSYKMMFDEVGNAVRAIGIEDTLSSSFFQDSPESLPTRLMPEAMLSDLILHMRLNLSRDSIEEFWLEGKDILGNLESYSASMILSKIRGKLERNENEKEIVKFYDTDYILTHFQSDEDWIVLEGHGIDRGGNIRRIRHVWHITTSPFTREKMLNAYLIQSTIPDEWDSILKKQQQHMYQSLLYDRSVMDNIAASIFQEPASMARAVGIFQISGLNISERAKQGNLRKSIGAILSMALGGSSVLGNYGPDRFFILFPSPGGKENLRHHVEQAITFIRRVLKKDLEHEQIRLIAGLAIQSPGGVGYGTLLTAAAYSCTRRWNSPVDTISFANEAEEQDWTMLQDTKGDDRVSVLKQEPGKPLSESEKDVAFNCMSIMLSADSFNASVHGVLRNIGMYYQADRVYVLYVANDRKVITMPFEWDDSCKCSIQQVVSGMLIENFPLIKRCMEENAPIFLTRSEKIKRENAGEQDKKWYFSAYPLEVHGVIEGFLCIENAKKYPTNAALFSTLIPYILREKERFSGNGKEQSGKTVEQLMGLPDLRSYMNTISQLDSEKYNTLGAVCVDIPSMAAINNGQGFEAGSRMLWYVSKTLTDIFGPSLLFRTWEAEFIAFCPNTTKEVFLGRCSRLNSIIQRRYPKEIRIGEAWADGVFSGRKLVEEARQDMREEKDEFFSSSPSILSMGKLLPRHDPSLPQPVVFYQPQIDMSTGSMIGAEALVRGIDRDGSLIPPSRFIDTLEEKGTIRELDMFVLNAALSQVALWKKEGYGTIPVTVNFSRITLLYPSTLASVLAIQSRYPEIAPSTLELEITEGSAVLENKEFRSLVDKFRNYGLHISLDDFGSKYANLSLFTNVMFDTVKLDRSLISELADNQINRMLVHDLVQLCNARGMRCIAEGVETEEQRKALLEAGCHFAQGFYYDRPLSQEQFEEKYLRKTSGREPFRVN